MANDKVLHLVVDGKTSTSEIIKRCLGDRIDVDGRRVKILDVSANEFSRSAIVSEPSFLVRVADPAIHDRIAELVSSRQPYAYLIDDNFWLLLGDSPLDEFYKNPNVRRSLEMAVSGAFVVFCHSERFREFLLKFNPNVHILPTYFDFSCVDNVAKQDVGDELRIGLVGNISRAADLELVVPAVQSIADRPGMNVVFEFFGYTPPALVSHPRVRSFSAIDNYKEFLQTQYSRNWLLGLAPLSETRFSAYKTNNKFREFGGCEIAAIYSDVSVYRESVEHGRTGWLVPNDPKAWEEAILAAISDPVATRMVGREAHQKVLRAYALEHVRDEWAAALQPMFQRQEFSRVSRWVRRCLDRLRRKPKGEGLPAIALKNGWGQPPECGASNGFYRGTTILSVERADTLSTTLDAPVDGPFHWSIVLATFCTMPVGAIVVRVAGAGAVAQELIFKEEVLQDGAHLSLLCDLKAGLPVSIDILNKTDKAVGVHVLSPNGHSKFGSTGRSFPGRFIA